MSVSYLQCGMPCVRHDRFMTKDARPASLCHPRHGLAKMLLRTPVTRVHPLTSGDDDSDDDNDDDSDDDNDEDSDDDGN